MKWNSGCGTSQHLRPNCVNRFPLLPLFAAVKGTKIQVVVCTLSVESYSNVDLRDYQNSGYGGSGVKRIAWVQFGMAVHHQVYCDNCAQTPFFGRGQIL